MPTAPLTATQVAFLDRYLGVTFPDARAEAPDPSIFPDYLGPLETDLALLAADAPEAATRIRAMLDSAIARNAAGDLVGGLAGLDAASDALSRARSEARQEVAQASIPEGKALLEKLVQRWIGDKAAYRARLDSLADEIIDDAEDPSAAGAVNTLSDVLRRFDQGLTAALDTMRQTADPAGRARLAAEASTIAGNYVAHIASDPVLSHLRTNPFGIDVDAASALTPGLQDLIGQLRKLGA